MRFIVSEKPAAGDDVPDALLRNADFTIQMNHLTPILLCEINCNRSASAGGTLAPPLR
jgi:hypothetical protein